MQEYINTITQGNCIELMARLQDKEIDLCLTDPPYNVGLAYDVHNDSMPDSEYRDFCVSWFQIAQRKAKKIAFSCGDSNLKMWLDISTPDKVGFWFKSGICRVEPMLFYGCNIDVIIAPIRKIAELEGKHPCPKPLLWAHRAIELLTKENDLVLDPFSGTGTVCVAASLLHRRFMGFDKSAQYVELNRRRIEEATAQQNLFGAGALEIMEGLQTAANNQRDAIPLDIFEGV